VAAAKILETDLWVQYQEIADTNPAFQAALTVLDSDMVQYVDDNTDDENSHQLFLNAFLTSVGALSKEAILPASYEIKVAEQARKPRKTRIRRLHARITFSFTHLIGWRAPRTDHNM
jgi:hypothetical protein